MVRNALLLSASSLVLLAGCSEYREETRTAARNETMTSRAPGTVAMFRQRDPSLGKYFDNAYAYAIFPEVAKGAAGIGAANGSGVVYQGGKVVGYTELTQVTVGAQIGGQSYREVIFFQDARAFDKFKSGRLEFAANASAVIVESGAGATNDYRDGVAVFAMPNAGAMLEAAIGGQTFTFRPVAAGGASLRAAPASSTTVAQSSVGTTTVRPVAASPTR